MGAKVTYATRHEARDVTALLTGQPDGLPEDEMLEMTDWDRFADFWNRVADAMDKKYGKENNNAETVGGVQSDEVV